jgi:uncharacterized protein (DUF58 family)
MTLPAHVLKRIQYIEIKTRRLVQNQFAGAYQSLYKGPGLLFDSVRPYEVGDDVRTIDWNVTARTQIPHVKKFVEERELTVMLVVDASASVFFGSVGAQKRDFASEIAAVLAWCATLNRDRVGLLLFSDRIEQWLSPSKSRNHLLRLITTLITHQPTGTGTDLTLALQTFNRMSERGTVLFIMSDFLTASDEFFKQLRATSKRHDVAALVLSDPIEDQLPDVGMIHLQDVESGQTSWVDTSSSTWQAQFKVQRAEQIQRRDTLLRRAGVKLMNITPYDDYVRALVRFFRVPGT